MPSPRLAAGAALAAALAVTLGIAPTAHAAPPPLTPGSSAMDQYAPGPVRHHAVVPLVRHAAERVMTADQVAAAKWITGAPIEDPEREQQVLDAMDAQAQRLGIDRATVQRVFRDQIEANKLVQRRLHDRWQRHPDEAPATAPDLGDIRDEINRLNGALLTSIRQAQPLLSAPGCAAARERARAVVVRELHLHGRHGQGLRKALSHLCVA